MTKRERRRRAKELRMYRKAQRSLQSSWAMIDELETTMRRQEPGHQMVLAMISLHETLRHRSEGLQNLVTYAADRAFTLRRYGHNARGNVWQQFSIELRSLLHAVEIRLSGLIPFQSVTRLLLPVGQERIVAIVEEHPLTALQPARQQLEALSAALFAQPFPKLPM